MFILSPGTTRKFGILFAGLIQYAFQLRTCHAGRFHSNKIFCILFSFPIFSTLFLSPYFFLFFIPFLFSSFHSYFPHFFLPVFRYVPLLFFTCDFLLCFFCLLYLWGLTGDSLHYVLQPCRCIHTPLLPSSPVSGDGKQFIFFPSINGLRRISASLRNCSNDVISCSTDATQAMYDALNTSVWNISHVSN
jgi:hypothetical protein